MPPFPDLEPDVGHGQEPTVAAPAGPLAPEDVLLRVKAEGLRRRSRRHRRNALLAALGLAVVAVPAVTLLPADGGPEGVTVAADPGDGDAADTGGEREASTTVAEGPTTAVPTTSGEVAAATTAVEESRPPITEPLPPTTVAPAAPETTTPAPQCRNSADPACGEFRWDPAPGPNEPLTASFVDVPATVTAGEPVTLFVAWSDPDATLTFDNFSAEGVALAPSCAVERRYGPWTPPEPAGGSGELSYTHTFASPGTYTVIVSLGTGTCGEPYASERTVQLDITVQ